MKCAALSASFALQSPCLPDGSNHLCPKHQSIGHGPSPVGSHTPDDFYPVVSSKYAQPCFVGTGRSAKRYVHEGDEFEEEEEEEEGIADDDDKDPSFRLGASKRSTGQRSARQRPTPQRAATRVRSFGQLELGACPSCLDPWVLLPNQPPNEFTSEAADSQGFHQLTP